MKAERTIRVTLGVTGCIAAYKAVEVMRGLQKRGAAVQVAMTRHATEFVAPLTFQAISGQPVIADMFAPTDDPEIRHIALAQSVDLLLVAPATANILAKFANGLADDFLSTMYISTTAPVLVAPAMNVEMWQHPATRENVQRLRDRGVHFTNPGEGYLACKTVGPGRLAEPADIVDHAWRILTGDCAAAHANSDLSGEHVLITAGPTYEALDPVRGLTNRSSGKMGYALARAAADRGARVTLVSGPVALEPPPDVDLIRVRSAQEMYDAVMAALSDSTLVVMAAAVADYRPASIAGQKIKKNGDQLSLVLEKTPDILNAVGARKDKRVVVGFAAETENLITNARAKLMAKQADLIVANDVSAEGSGFDVDTNRITLVTESFADALPLLSKLEAANRILDAALKVRS